MQTEKKENELKRTRYAIKYMGDMYGIPWRAFCALVVNNIFNL